MFNSCVMDTVNSLCIRNCTKDTLFLELTEVDTLGKGIYWSKDNKDIGRLIFPEDTTGVCIHGGKVFCGFLTVQCRIRYLFMLLYLLLWKKILVIYMQLSGRSRHSKMPTIGLEIVQLCNRR